MAQRSTGYNNPAFCNQYENSLYDYEYVPEIDPDSPDFTRKGSYRVSRQIAPRWDPQSAVKMLNNSNSSSDGSVIIEESNNRRVTLICEKRKPVVPEKDGGYSHDISLESDSNNEDFEHFNRMDTIRARMPTKPTNKCRNDEPQNNPRYNVPPPRPPNHYEDPPPYEEHVPSRRHRYAEIDEELETEGVHFSRKPRAPSPPNFDASSPPFGTPPNFGDFYRQTSSPLEDTSNSFEMSDFAPKQRQPPIGASTNHVLESGNRYQEIYEEKIKRTPSHSERTKISTPRSGNKIPRVFTNKLHSGDKERQKQSVRRNISSSFTESNTGSPYRTTTQKIPRTTAIITPILQRKFAEFTRERSGFQKASRMFQSTTNVQKASEGRGYQIHPQNNLNLPQEQPKLKRNQSVPNFQQQYEKRTPRKVKHEVFEAGFRNIEYHVSPQKSPEKFSPLSKSRLSLLETQKIVAEEGGDAVVVSGGCVLVAAVVQLLAGLVTCGICFYLLSKLGRRYYLEIGTIAGFITSVLGTLGFRQQRWKWLANRNYISGYLISSGFSVLNLASVLLIIIVKPHSGDPFLDVCAGAICAASIIVIAIALTGVTMSGCCKTPPPDNRVNSV